jgi:hypothetical protein
VRLVAGDPGSAGSIYRINMENTLAIDHTPDAGALFSDRTITVEVNDGRLSLSNAAGAVNNKINFIDVRSAEYVAPPLPLPLPPRPVAPGQVLAPIGPTSGGSGEGSSGSPGSTLLVPISTLVFSQQPISPEEVLP